MLLKENVRNLKKNCELTSYAIIFGQRTLFSIIKLAFRGKFGFYLFYHNTLSYL